MTKTKHWIQNILAIAVFVLMIVLVLIYAPVSPKYEIILQNIPDLLVGLLSTLVISLITLGLSMVLGFVLFLMMKSKVQFISALAKVFKEIIMGTPLLIMLFLAVYVVGALVGFRERTVLGVLALTFYMAPYMANAYVGAYEVIDSDQYAVMKLYNFTPFQKYRYVVLPQMIKPIIPNIISVLSTTIKGSALLKIIMVTELSYVMDIITLQSGASVEGYLIMWIMYLAVTIPLSITAQLIAEKLSK